MKRLGAEEVVYRDIEKFYRVLGYYEGLEIKPLELHEKFIDQNLENSLRNDESYIRRIQFLIRMTEVIAAKHVVYTTEKPEASLVYSLFSEGIQSLIALRDLAAVDIKDWASLVRKALIDFDSSDSKDLASILWRNPSRNIRARVFNSLFDAEGFSETDESTDKKSNWHRRDKDWELPDGETVERSENAALGISAQKLAALKSQILSPSILAELPAELKLETDEITRLADELSSLDQDHVDFNLLNWAIQVLKASATADTLEFQNAETTLLTLTEGIVARFQPSLIILLLNELSQMSSPLLTPLRSRMEKAIGSTLSQLANQKRLISSLEDPERAKVSVKLLPYLDPKQFAQIIDFYRGQKDYDGLVEFLKIILNRDLAHETLFFSWGEERLASILPLFRRLDWKGKYEFLKRALKSPYAKIVKAASHYLSNISLETPAALKLYEGLPDDVKEVWLKALLEAETKDRWKPFVKTLIQSGIWGRAEDRLMSGRLMSGWAQLCCRYFGAQGLESLEPWIKARRWFFWPKFPMEREASLNALMSQKDLLKVSSVADLLKQEARVSNQDEALKQKLMIHLRSLGR